MTFDNRFKNRELPKYAVSISKDGSTWEILEREVLGYITQNVEGRETLEHELKYLDFNSKYGKTYSNFTMPIRKLKINFTITADNEYKYNEKLSLLKQKFSSERFYIRFNDEVDKYFIGNTSSIVGTRVYTDVPRAALLVNGEIDIECEDPHKYSMVTKTFDGRLGDDGFLECNIENAGNTECDIDYEIKFNSDNGFVGIVSDNGIMQYGLVDETDEQNFPHSEVLLTTKDFFNAPDKKGTGLFWGATFNGTTGLARDSWRDSWLCLNTRSAISGKWTGAMKEILVPADSAGEVGALNCYLWFRVYFHAGLMGQTGFLQVGFLDDNNTLLYGYSFHKTDMSGNTAYMDAIVNGKVKKTYSFQANHLDTDNPFNRGRGSMDILRENERVQFYYWGQYFSFTDSAIKNKKVTKIQIGFAQYSTRNMNTQYVTINRITDITFTKHKVDDYRDVPNRYGNGDVLKIVGSESKAYKNDLPCLGDEIVGTKYFKAGVGNTKVLFTHSNWAKEPIEAKATIRERWI